MTHTAIARCSEEVPGRFHPSGKSHCVAIYLQKNTTVLQLVPSGPGPLNQIAAFAFPDPAANLSRTQKVHRGRPTTHSSGLMEHACM